MKITVFGSGYVGLTVGVCLAELGNNVICVDIDEAKVKSLREGSVPIYEPGLGDMLKRNIQEKRISFTTDAKVAVKHAEIIFTAVGTPPGKDDEADLSAVRAVAKTIAENMSEYKIIVNKSTVPVGTGDIVKKIIEQHQKEKIDFDVVSNPEFLREGAAIRDFMNPDRVVIGIDSEKPKKILHSLFEGITRIDRPIMFTDIKSAEIIKYASNAMLATRISFMNEIAALCEKTGADIKDVAEGMGLDKRIGPRFLQAGIGYGGSCFPKDVKALAKTLEQHDLKSTVITAVEQVNEQQKKSLLPKVKKLVPDLNGKTIAIWGLAFKPKTDDIREAPSITIINQLQEAGATIKAFDPEAEETAKTILQNITYTKDPYEAAIDADALIIVTEWNEFRNLDLKKVKELLNAPNIVDGRNIYDPKDMEKLGFNYIGVGR
ncbi:MAG: UDP-glucose/GDP-mannose dehydrogenase family protein [Nanoarchaeota archaeon]|nr:UDP-glucose/GDP-mannose dehydrogenase family protein [Nanoarchaeota archaeon]